MSCACRAQSRVSIIFCALSRKFKILAIPDVLAHGKSYEHGFMKKRDGHKLCAKSRAVMFRSVFRAPSRKFEILDILVLLAHGKLYEHGIAKKRDGHKFCVKVEFRSVFCAQSRKFKNLAIPDVLAHVKFRSVFDAPSRKFKILAIPDVLAHGKSYEHGFAKKLDGHILCMKSRAESSFDRFDVHRLGNSKYWSFQTY
ncbi:hypothetical protein B296_00057816 [Ensete ventricosum]|uniref:Uncharacterized protein n=1 Tax=Ensete ventricosum TaxID=4639 RepID=A0A426WW22_ENSVE|nr:hypothetical protein B296_00057816 [Ensete ventricosum]